MMGSDTGPDSLSCVSQMKAKLEAEESDAEEEVQPQPRKPIT